MMKVDFYYHSLFCKFRTTVGKGGIQLVLAVTVNVNIGVPHKGAELDFLVVAVNGNKHH